MSANYMQIWLNYHKNTGLTKQLWCNLSTYFTFRFLVVKDEYGDTNIDDDEDDSGDDDDDDDDSGDDDEDEIGRASCRERV